MPAHLPRIAAVAAAALALAPAAARADAPATVHATPAQAARLLFVAGDVQRLGRNPSGTVGIVLEKVLQQEYRADASLPPTDAQADVQKLRGALDVNTESLQVQPGNQRVLAILASFERSNPAPRVRRALARVADAALSESSAAGMRLGRRFFPEADSFATLLYGGFSPAATLQDTTEQAAANSRFGQARDALWSGAAHESVFDGPTALLAGNPALQSDAVRAVTRGLAGDGSLTVSAAGLQGLIRDGLQAVGAQTTQAIADHRAIGRACATGMGCDSARDKAQADGGAARAAIPAQHAALTVAGGLLEPSDPGFAAAVMAEAQAAAQVAASVNAYFAAEDYGQYAHIGADVAGLAIGLAAVEVDPAAAVSGVLNVVGDIAGVAVTGPDANMLILQGLQGVSQQLSAFASETAEQFAGVDARLAGLTRSVATLAGDLSSQLATAQAQLIGLRSALTNLQGSVDELRSEIELLFRTEATNDLGKVANQAIGYAAHNTSPLGVEDFNSAAGAFYQDATATALTRALLTEPTRFDIDAVAGLGSLDANVNFFDLFPGSVTDGPRAGSLSSACLGEAGTNFCLPDPDFWAASSRAFAQLLLENRDRVTRDRLGDLDIALGQGGALDKALRKISANDTGDGTGSRTYNFVLDYYRSWIGRDADRSGTPALVQAIRSERKRWLDLQQTPGLTASGPWIDPYGGVNQSLANVSLPSLPAFQSVRSGDHSQFTIPSLTPVPELISRLPLPLQNAVRLGLGRLDVTWTTQWATRPGVGSPGLLGVTFWFNYTRPDGVSYLVGTVYAQADAAVNCAGVGDDTDGNRTFVAGWNQSASGCTNWRELVRQAALDNPDRHYFHNDRGFAQATTDTTPLVAARLKALRAGSLKHLVEKDGTLTRGDAEQADDVFAAAKRAGAAQALIGDYVTLGLPQALATDDSLRSLLSGDGANALRHPFGDERSAEPADGLPGQVASFLKFEADEDPQSDPINTLGLLLDRHRSDLESAIGGYVRAAGKPDALDEGSPVVTSTLDRLELTKDVLNDALDHPAPNAGTPAVTPSPAAAAPQAVAPAQAVEVAARLVHAPRAHGRAIRFTVKCVSGNCPVAVTVKSGRRTLGHASIRLASGRTRTVTVRLTAAGRRLVARRGHLRVTVRITVARRALATRSITLR